MDWAGRRAMYRGNTGWGCLCHVGLGWIRLDSPVAEDGWWSTGGTPVPLFMAEGAGVEAVVDFGNRGGGFPAGGGVAIDGFQGLEFHGRFDLRIRIIVHGRSMAREERRRLPPGGNWDDLF